MWFDTWSSVLRTVLLGSASYATLIVVLRLSGKRTLSQLNAFDFIVTVALGSTLASILLSSTVSWAQGTAALVLLALLQLVIALISSRWQSFRKAVTAEPTVLVRDGLIDTEALRRQRLSESGILQAIRSSGVGDLSKVGAVVLETNGTFSVIPVSSLGDASALPSP